MTEEAVTEEAEPERELETVAAAVRPPVSRIALRRPAETLPLTNQPADMSLADMGLTAAANAPGTPAGQKITDWGQLADVFSQAIEASKGFTNGAGARIPVVRAGRDNANQYPESHRLDANMGANMAKIQATQRTIQAEGGMTSVRRNGIQASGGVCAPEEVNYDQPILGDTARPVRDGFLTRFGADRGGVTTMPPPVLENLDSATTLWTEANDQEPSSPTTKPCLTVTCPSEDNTLVDAIVACLEYGNFRARFFPEQIEAWMRLAMVNHARLAEETLLAAIATGSTAVTTGEVLGTSRTVLAALDRAIAVWRYRHRDDNITLSFAAPAWLRDQIRADIARQFPVGSVGETLALADAEINTFFAARNIDPVWLLDGETGQRFTVQGAGVLQGWPDTVKTYLAPAGGWLFLDGGTLDLGLVRDSTLNCTNDVQMFVETFEAAHFHGPESWTVEFDSCPDGSVAASADTTGICAYGS